MAALPQSHPLARRNAPLSMTDLADESFILFPRGLGCGLFDHVSVLASRAGFAPQVGQEAREGATIIGLVAAGMGISILPDTYMKTGIPGVAYRELDTPDAQSQVLLAYRSEDGSALVQRFRETARAAQ
jgi:DNA-binding transcriptional LysR family regulator